MNDWVLFEQLRTQAFLPQCLSLAVFNAGEGLVKLSHVQ